MPGRRDVGFAAPVPDDTALSLHRSHHYFDKVRECMQAVEVQNLTKKFADLVALDGVSFSVDSGEIFGYLGPNGAGKTTTIRILTGITLPTAGTARIFGRDIVTDTIMARRQMGIVYETSNVYDDLSAWQNMMFAGELYNVGRRKRHMRTVITTGS